MKNQVRLMGNVGAVPDVKVLDGNKKVAKFSIATNEVSKNAKGEKLVDTQWHNLIAWGNTAALIEKLVQKGAEVAIEGKLVHRTYTDKEGVKKYVTEVLVNEFVLLGKKTA
jgi:single-strand DNA-binding protein